MVDGRIALRAHRKWSPGRVLDLRAWFVLKPVWRHRRTRPAFFVLRPTPVTYFVVHITDTDQGGERSMTQVFLRQGESQEHLLKRFRKKVTRDRIMSDVKRKRFFVSNSEKRRLALRKAKRRERRRKWRAERRRRY